MAGNSLDGSIKHGKRVGRVLATTRLGQLGDAVERVFVGGVAERDADLAFVFVRLEPDIQIFDVVYHVGILKTERSALIVVLDLPALDGPDPAITARTPHAAERHQRVDVTISGRRGPRRGRGRPDDHSDCAERRCGNADPTSKWLHLISPRGAHHRRFTPQPAPSEDRREGRLRRLLPAHRPRPSLLGARGFPRNAGWLWRDFPARSCTRRGTRPSSGRSRHRAPTFRPS